MKHMVDGAKRYAASDRSDPFTFRRAMSHISNGLASKGIAELPYDAIEYAEERSYTLNGATVVYTVPAHKSAKRP